MAFGFWSLLEALLLVVNGVCVLHEERFLAKIGWGREQVQGFGQMHGGGGGNVKSQILNLIRSIRTVMRIPLIFINIAVILVKMVLG